MPLTAQNHKHSVFPTFRGLGKFLRLKQNVAHDDSAEVAQPKNMAHVEVCSEREFVDLRYDTRFHEMLTNICQTMTPKPSCHCGNWHFFSAPADSPYEVSRGCGHIYWKEEIRCGKSRLHGTSLPCRGAANRKMVCHTFTVAAPCQTCQEKQRILDLQRRTSDDVNDDAGREDSTQDESQA